MRAALVTASDPDTHVCPNCLSPYQPDVADPTDAPDQSIAREQHLSGICSNQCWRAWTTGSPTQHQLDAELKGDLAFADGTNPLVRQNLLQLLLPAQNGVEPSDFPQLDLEQ